MDQVRSFHLGSLPSPREIAWLAGNDTQDVFAGDALKAVRHAESAALETPCGRVSTWRTISGAP